MKIILKKIEVAQGSINIKKKKKIAPEGSLSAYRHSSRTTRKQFNCIAKIAIHY